jgi:Protein of unknown function (DUF1499)
MRIWRGLTRNRAYTGDDDVPDPRLRAREYAIPFFAVWQAALQVARSSRRWTVTGSDSEGGEIVAEARTLLGFVDDVWIRISLDEDGQTRVDMTSASRKGSADLGTNARRIARFLHALDRHLAAGKRANR